MPHQKYVKEHENKNVLLISRTGMVRHPHEDWRKPTEEERKQMKVIHDNLPRQ